jgi:predicted GNAT superfamily acetyltransferase
MKTTINIRQATKDDLTEVLTIANQWSLGELSDSEAENGFLVSAFVLEQYEDYLANAEYFYVAEVEGRIEAFLLAYESESIDPSEITNTLLRCNLVESFILIKQICVRKDSPNTKGGASSLYDYLHQQQPDKSNLAAVVLEPLNKRSIKFHERCGFYKLCDITPPADKDGKTRLRGIWYRPPKNNKEHCPTLRFQSAVESKVPLDTLNTRQEIASSLYTHEDNLNWTKLGLLVTFMFALTTAFNHLMGKSSEELGVVGIFTGIMVIVIGHVIIELFKKKIDSGLNYMQQHKESVKKLDILVQAQHPSCPSILNGNKEISGKSATAKGMKWIPLICRVGWWGMTLALIGRLFNLI